MCVEMEDWVVQEYISILQDLELIRREMQEHTCNACIISK